MVNHWQTNGGRQDLGMVLKELRRIAKAAERIADALEASDPRTQTEAVVEGAGVALRRLYKEATGHDPDEAEEEE